MNKVLELAMSQIEDIVINCEEIQKSHESAYRKEQAKVEAYNEIRTCLGIEVKDE